MRFAIAICSLICSLTLGLAAGLPVGPVHAQTGSIHLDAPWARAASGGGSGAGAGHSGAMKGNGAVYLKVSNHGRTPDAIVSASSDAADAVELHEVVNDAGVMRMRPVPRIEVPAGATVELKPGGYHIMLLGLRGDLKPGATVRVRLSLEKAGSMTVEAPVR
jgi:copper(I)-binding protein